MASSAPIDNTTNPVCVVVESATNSRWPICDGFPCETEESKLIECQKLTEKIIEIETKPTTEIYNFIFPNVDDTVASIYWDILIALERQFAIYDYFTNPEIHRIVKAIDNRDYVKQVYPDTDVGWQGLLVDSGIFRAIARYKKQHNNPLLVSVALMCSALTTPMPKHLYYLKFRFPDGSDQVVSYRSGDDLLSLLTYP